MPPTSSPARAPAGGDTPRPTAQRERLPSHVFRLPVQRMRSGYYSDAYFNNAKELLEEDARHTQVLMQVFQKHSAAVLGGIDEAIAVLRECSGSRHADGSWERGWEQLQVRALHEGEEISEREVVLTIEGDYSLFAHLETVYLGCLSRRTKVMSNVARVVEAAAGKPIFFFPARHDHWLVQTGDGWAAHVAGAIGVSTSAQASWWGGRGIGTVPHSLIAAYGGDTVAAAARFAERFHRDMNVTVLVDFENNSAHTALEVARALGPRLWGVRLDTSETLIDESVAQAPADAEELRGVNPELVLRVREQLDAAGFAGVKIVVSGGFDVERIARFEAQRVPVDAYGVGSSLLRGSHDFTADIVEVEGRPCSKVGRERWPSERLSQVL